VSADCDGIVKTWDVRMVKQEAQFDTGLNSANCAIFDRAQQSVYVASEDSTIKVFNLNTGEKEGELKGHEDAVLDLTWDNSKDGFLISAGSDCSFRMWQ
jgi:WD40 repeat protein